MNTSRIFETQDGSHSIVSEQFGESYHSKYGAIQESRHVFIEAGLHRAAQQKKSIDILEIGWGTGLNTFLSFLEGKKRELTIHYTGVEAYPINQEEALKLNYPEMLQCEVTEGDLFYQMHQQPWEIPCTLLPGFSLQKTCQRFENLDYNNQFDLIYFDAFAPSAQPELWEKPVLEKMYKSLKNSGIFVTYCAKGSMKRILKNLGFTVEALPGPPGKREMTRAFKQEF
ncbi:MAG: hypothetical protein DHS20C18_16910 [Saprospiraceae bacterium]|nr:MAG: hypothetical protein DHS20C18_16910 [Saprospiraceae bacterium]